MYAFRLASLLISGPIVCGRGFYCFMGESRKFHSHNAAVIVSKYIFQFCEYENVLIPQIQCVENQINARNTGISMESTCLATIVQPTRALRIAIKINQVDVSTIQIQHHGLGNIVNQEPEILEKPENQDVCCDRLSFVYQREVVPMKSQHYGHLKKTHTLMKAVDKLVQLEKQFTGTYDRERATGNQDRENQFCKRGFTDRLSSPKQ